MPFGIITNASAILVGGILGVVLGSHIKDSIKEALNNTLGVIAITMGVVLITRVHTLSAVVLAVLLGCLTGELLNLEARINGGVSAAVGKLMGGKQVDDGFLIKISAVVVLFCFSGTGWYGALTEGMTGDGSILITKSILDLITACLFGSMLGVIVPALSIAQILVMLALFFLAGLVQPYITPSMIADFSAAGGIITLCAGLRLSGIKRDIKVLNLLPTLIYVFFVSAIWTSLLG